MDDFDFPVPPDPRPTAGGTRYVAEHSGQITGVRAPVGRDGWWTESFPEPIQVGPGDVVVAEWTPDGATVRVDRGAA